MSSQHLLTRAQSYLANLCIDIPTRRVGSDGNRAATSFVAQVLRSFGFRVECPTFDCIDWTQDGVRLAFKDEPFDAFASPYSLACRVDAPLAVVSTVQELEKVQVSGKILMLHGEIAKEQLMPKNFVFYNPDEHKHIIHLLETQRPLGIVAATTRNPEMAGAVYPFPLIEDGDFGIPSVYMTEEAGNRLAQYAGKNISLAIRAQRISSQACNVIARKGDPGSTRIVLTAHIDSKDGTPGALDDASGIVTLLLFAELVRDYDGQLGIEIAILNGEDHYSAAGEVQYLKQNQDKFDEIQLCINLDDLGFHQGHTAYSLYECPDVIADSIHDTFARHPDIKPGDAWYQGDHIIFVQNGAPALAITSQSIMEILFSIAHTTQDTPAIVDCSKLASVACALRELIDELTH